MKLQLKLREGSSEAELREILGRVNGLRFGRIHSISPGHPVPEMRSLYSLDVSDSIDSESLIGRLKRERAIEFVEVQAVRKLIKPVRR